MDNLLAKERAAKIAMTVKGVRAVVNDIEVMPLILRTDRDIRLDIEDALLYDPATDSYEIDVAVKNNVATLSGTVDSLQEVERVGHPKKRLKMRFYETPMSPATKSRLM